MRLRSAWIALAVAASGSGCAHWARVAPEDPRLRYTGRMDLRDPAGPRFSHTGSAVAVRVESPALRFHLRDRPLPWEGTGALEPNHYEVVVDGAPSGVLVAAGPEVRHTVELGPGEHLVELFKRTEPAVGQGQFLGLELPPGGRLLEPPARPERRIEIIGDSLTTGFGNAGAGPRCPFSARTEDGYRSYAALAGRMVHAEVHLVAWHGRGVARNYDLSSAGTIPQLYERALPEDPASPWDFSRWTPHVVVIAAGVNDFMQPNLDIAAFERAYLDLVAQVRRRYPEALILCARQGVTDEWPVGARHGTLSREAMDRVMQKLAASGDARVKDFEFDLEVPEDGKGCVWHASLRSHEVRAGRLRVVLHQALGW